MRTVSYRGKGGQESHTIYEEVEAQGHEIPYLRDWRQAKEIGQWVLTDDGQVVEVLNLGRRDGELIWIRTCTGTFAGQAKRLTTEERECRWTFNGRYPRHSKRLKANQAFARLVLSGMPIVKAYLQTHPNASDTRRTQYRAMALFESETVQNIVAEELKDILTKLKIDREYVLRGYKRLAEEADSDSVSISAFNALAKVVGLTEEKKTTTRGVFVGFSGEEIAQVQAAAAGQLRLAEAEIVAEEGNLTVEDAGDMD